jgi:2-polyprenyl-3-methyl-5-hydroxy-6-metoxy-1,4-benzoquinol methylase
MNSDRLQSELQERPRGAYYGKDSDELPGKSYRGLAIQADAPDVHEIALELLRSLVPGRRGVLDIAAGSGAFSLRLLDNGFTGIEAIELCAEKFAVPNVPVHPLNLDGPWSSQLPVRYDAAVALEIIEHLENPWHFARECAAAVRPGGVLVVSTPNIESSRSRLEFLLRAEFRFFGERDFQRIGHITSLTLAQLVRVFTEAGFTLVARKHSRHKGMYRPGNPKRVLRAALYALTYPLMSGQKQGEITLLAFRREEKTTVGPHPLADRPAD